MSKKLAEGLDALVLDVKTGEGAFMKSERDAEQLAQLLVETGTRMGKKVVALITGMDQPLGRNVGNALEVEECIDVLRGRGPADLRELCEELAAWMFLLGGRTKSVSAGRELAREMIATGRARDTFREVVRLQGGDAKVVDDSSRLPRARNEARVKAKAAGFVTRIHTESVGVASLLLGGGREKKEDAVDPAVGLEIEKKIGDAVRAGDPLCTVHYNAETRLAESIALLEKSFEIGSAAPRQLPLVREIIGAENVE
jgi:pyrimidine-nucleoside phosphorylase